LAIPFSPNYSAPSKIRFLIQSNSLSSAELFQNEIFFLLIIKENFLKKQELRGIILKNFYVQI